MLTFTLLLGAAFAVACATPPPPPPRGEPAQTTYVLEAGDSIEILSFGIPELNDTVVIGPSGYISAVLIDNVKAAGLTVAELDAALTEGYSDHFPDPELSVVVRTFANLRVYVGGEVTNAGMVPLTAKTTIAMAVFERGGLKVTAKTSSVILLRNSGSAEPDIYMLDLGDVLQKGAPDVVLQPFDIVFVPKTFAAKIGDAVDQFRRMIPMDLGGNFVYSIQGGTLDLGSN